MKRLTAFTFGVVFALGLGLAGMTQPEKIIAFLDVAGNWDASLAFVMGFAVLVGLLAFPAILKRPSTWFGDPFSLPDLADIDTRLVLGAALFGVGWGLSGYCPGPALVSLVTGSWGVITFLLFMAAGLSIGSRLRQTPSPAVRTTPRDKTTAVAP